MAGQRQPIELVLAKGSKHLRKKKRSRREKKNSEVKPITDDISPPPYLSMKRKQKEKFNKIADQLMNLKILGEIDVDT